MVENLQKNVSQNFTFKVNMYFDWFIIIAE